jgi:hypothetical protein
MEFGLVIGFIDHLHVVEFTTARTKSSQYVVSCTCCRLVTASNAVVSSSSVFTSIRLSDGLGVDHIENTASSTVKSRSCRTDRVENTGSQSAH